MIRAILVALLVLVPLSVVSAGTTSGCSALGATSVGEFYIAAGRGELWRESNGVPGLQIRSTAGCAAPPDECILLHPVNGGPGAQAGCLQTAALSALS